MVRKKFKLFFSVLIPAYNSSTVIGDTLRSILSQEFDNYEIVISDDKSNDDTEAVVKTFRDKRIKFYKHRKNVGYSMNLERGRKYCNGDILYLMGHDDILGRDALMDTYNAFMSSDDIGAVTRPYFWFQDEDIEKPVRAKRQLNPRKDEVVYITDAKKKVIYVFTTLDQLSGLAYRIKYMNRGFHPDIFPCHIYPFVSIFKNHPVVFLKDYEVAVRIATSQTRSVRWIYNKSPMLSWVEMVQEIFKEKEFEKIRNYLIRDFIACNYVGQIQIKNYADFPKLIRELGYLIKFRPRNLMVPEFWFFALGTIITPSWILIPMVDWYKEKIQSRLLREIKFKYRL